MSIHIGLTVGVTALALAFPCALPSPSPRRLARRARFSWALNRRFPRPFQDLTQLLSPPTTGASLAAAKAKAGAAAAAAAPIPFLPFTHNQILHAVNLGSLPAWFSLMLLPRWQHTDKITLAVALGYSLLYVTLAGVMVSQVLISMDAATFFTVEAIKSMFLDSTAVLAGWAHFIIFDLFTARYFVQDSGCVGIRTSQLCPAFSAACSSVPLVCSPTCA